MSYRQKHTPVINSSHRWTGGWRRAKCLSIPIRVNVQNYMRCWQRIYIHHIDITFDPPHRWKKDAIQTNFSITRCGLTRSREINDQLHKFSPAVSYQDPFHLNGACVKYEIEINRCPVELAVGMTIRAIMDDDDFKHDTWIVSKIYHRTNVMFVQPELYAAFPKVTCQSLIIPTTSDMK